MFVLNITDGFPQLEHWRSTLTVRPRPSEQASSGGCACLIHVLDAGAVGCKPDVPLEDPPPCSHVVCRHGPIAVHPCQLELALHTLALR